MVRTQTRHIAAIAVLSGMALVAGEQRDARAAEAYPARPIRLLVGFAPGGANDLVARAVATRLGPRLGQQVIVENRAGASGNIATELAARAAPDGYTLLLASVASFAMSPALLGKVPFDPINDFAPVTRAVVVTAILSVHPTVPVRSLKQFVALAKKQPGAINYASPGMGSIAHLSFERFWHTAGIRLNQVPYKGGGPAVADAIAGHVDCIVGLVSTQTPHVRAGRLRALAVSSLKRSSALPEVPTIAESGYPGFESSGWLGFAFPARTPPEIVDRIQREIVAVLNLREVEKQLQDLGLDAEPNDPVSFLALIKSDHARWDKLVRDAGLRQK
ncbi:MAG TPA: tripartite tricarboxylate transporter substrate binding protein [Burkholderiales bacterium]|nr:tripartite tricarboxylate transporter substrate binding protein [Burkholderiales bacterium]